MALYYVHFTLMNCEFLCHTDNIVSVFDQLMAISSLYCQSDC